jgi:glycosyltransferase involved in cell wall biosynthesis
VSGSPVISVLTPAYNRAHTLGRLYESLLAQTYREFEWVVIDDGSEDGTEALVRSWIADGPIEICYHRQPNRGKHVAVNAGLELARGEYTSIVDSDDWFPPDALERLMHHWSRIPPEQRDGFSGVVGLCAYDDGRIVGDRYPSDPLDCDPAELTYVYRVRGDKQSLVRTSVLREFPFPFDDVRYVTPQLVWNRMALKYRERHVNEVVLVKEYRRGGISTRALELQIRAAPATRQFYLEEVRLPRAIPLGRRLRSYANYVRFSLHGGTPLLEQANDAPSAATWVALAPLGVALYLRDRLRVHGVHSRP